MAAAAQFGPIQFAGNALAQTDARRTQALQAAALVSLLQEREKDRVAPCVSCNLPPDRNHNSRVSYVRVPVACCVCVDATDDATAVSYAAAACDAASASPAAAAVHWLMADCVQHCFAAAVSYCLSGAAPPPAAPLALHIVDSRRAVNCSIDGSQRGCLSAWWPCPGRIRCCRQTSCRWCCCCGRWHRLEEEKGVRERETSEFIMQWVSNGREEGKANALNRLE